MIYIIIYLSISALMLMYLNRDKEWIRWINHTIMFRFHVREFKLQLKSLDETQRLLRLVEWLDTNFWFKKYWFGRRMRKIVLKEIAKFE